MAAYVIADVNITDPEKYEGYKKLAPEAVAVHGGKFLARGGASVVLEGSWNPNRCVIIEFPSMEQAQRFYKSAEYSAAREARKNASDFNMIVVAGL